MVFVFSQHSPSLVPKSIFCKKGLITAEYKMEHLRRGYRDVYPSLIVCVSVWAEGNVCMQSKKYVAEFYSDGTAKNSGGHNKSH